MIKPQLYYQSQQANHTLLSLQRPFFHGIGSTTRTSTLPLWSEKQQLQRQKLKRLLLGPGNVHANHTSATTKHIDETTEKNIVKLKAVINVKITRAGFFSSLRLDRRIDDITDLLGKSLLLELVSSELDPGKYIYAYLYVYITFISLLSLILLYY